MEVITYRFPECAQQIKVIAGHYEGIKSAG
jgi:hypothetical protein